MCGRYLLYADIKDLVERYGILISRMEGGWQGEIFPSQTVPIVVGADQRRLVPLKWGFTPSYAKRPIINAREETVDQKPTFKKSFMEKRCIVPANAFFEWKEEDGEKVKHKIYLRERPIFSMAAIYDSFKDKEGKPFTAFSILTTRPNPLVSKIHNRMPVILKLEDEQAWLDNTIMDPRDLKGLIGPFDEGQMVLERLD